MRRVYLVADNDLDRAFGFKLELALALKRSGMSPQEGYIRDLIEMSSYDEQGNRDDYQPTIEEVFVVDKTKDKGLVGRVNVHTKQKLYADDVSPRNPKVKLGGDYLDELKKYLDEVGVTDKVIVARSQISDDVKRDVERLVPEPFRRIIIYS